MEEEKSSGMQGIFGLLLVVGGIALAVIILADLGGFMNSGSTSNAPNVSGINNLPGGSFLCSFLPSPSCVAQNITNVANSLPNTNTQAGCNKAGNIWYNGKCTTPRSAPGR
jgi:hypothetical protein